MREIKFRGKMLDDYYDHYASSEPIMKQGEWVYGYFTRNDENGNCYITNQTKTGGAHPWQVDPKTIGQFTGLHDKNGKEIYEGDVIKSIALSNDHHQRGAIIVSPVEYWCGNACLSITYVPIYPFCVNHELEVIGNIHDNPELLEVQP